MGLLLCLGLIIPLSGQDEEQAGFLKLIKIINLKKSSKGLGSFLLGAKKEQQVIPADICQLRNYEKAVCDTVNGTVLILSASGKIKKRITGFKRQKLVSPVSCCTDNSGNLYISDSALNLVLKFSPNFKFDRIFINHPGSRITGIVFLRNLFYCIDTPNHKVLCFNMTGNLEFSFGKRGTGPGQFNFPTHICCTQNRIYITDALNFRIQIFDFKGGFIKTFGENGNRGGNFSKPKGIAVDSSNNIYVADAMFDNIQIFNEKGQFLYHFGGPGHEKNQFWMPTAVLIDQDQLIWIADSYNNRLQVFKITRERQQ